MVGDLMAMIRVGIPKYSGHLGLLLLALLVALGCLRVLIAAQERSGPETGAEVPQEIRSAQETVLEPLGGQVEQLRLAAKLFLDAEDTLTAMPEELLGRSFILSQKDHVRAVCRRPGYVYAIAPPEGAPARQLIDRGFRRLGFSPFQLSANEGEGKAVVYQKPVQQGETIEFSPAVLLIFGPDERGGVPYSEMRSLDPPGFLPDGSEFKTWEAPLQFSKTYHVEQSNPRASDRNPGTKDRPFKTIGRAAELLEPGERVVVGAGVYREWVRPARGGTAPSRMISYETSPGAKVVIKGSEILRTKWEQSALWDKSGAAANKATVERLWMSRLPAELFGGYNPFAMANLRQLNQMTHFVLPLIFNHARSAIYLQVRGLIFQNGRRLTQVSRFADLYTNEGAYWVDSNGLTIHVAPHGGVDPNQAEWEITTREQIFAPERYNLGYIRVKGFLMEHAANGFPFPQRGAISTMQGHHWLVEDNTLQWVNSVGIDIGDQAQPAGAPPERLGYHVIRRNTLNDIGITGITGPKPRGSLIEQNVFRRNAWHDVEFIAEAAAIKTHTNLNFLVRQNLVLDTVHGCGIWIDWINSNTRITQNVIVNTGTNNGPGPGLGGIFIEAAIAPNWVDHNVVWGSIYTNGIFQWTASKTVIAHNLIGNSAAAAILLMDIPGRTLGNLGPIPAGGNTVVNNILANNGWNVGIHSTANRIDYNLLTPARGPHAFRLLDKEVPRKASYEPWPVPFKGLSLADWRNVHGLDARSSETEITAELNAETLELVWAVQGAVPEGPAIAGMDRDFWNRPRQGRKVLPGPFGTVPTKSARTVIDPRVPAK